MDAKPNPNCPVCGGTGLAWVSQIRQHVECSCTHSGDQSTWLLDETGDIESICSDHAEAWEDN